MKKLLGFLALFAISVFSLNASCIYITQPCGQVVQTVCPDYFKSDYEWQNFTKELNKAYCGSSDKVTPHPEKQPSTPQPAIP